LRPESDRTGRYGASCVVTTVPDIPVVQLPTFENEGAASAAASAWSVEVPRGRRPSPLVLAVLGVIAGIAAMALGAAAVVSAGATAGSSDPAPVVSRPTAPSESGVERSVLALLAKPSTERVTFKGSSGLVLAVGSGGRAAILVRGLRRAAPGKPYIAWIVAPGRAPLRAARFVGTERAVLLTTRVGRNQSVVVSPVRPLTGAPARNRVVALRD
jgi:hypothetical protein